MSGTIPKHLQELARIARSQSWDITVTGGNHLRWQPPSGRPIFTALTGHSSAAPDVWRLRKALGVKR